MVRVALITLALAAACTSNERDVSLHDLQSGVLELAITADASRVTVTLVLPDVSRELVDDACGGDRRRLRRLRGLHRENRDRARRGRKRPE